jgi:hypothetical protein
MDSIRPKIKAKSLEKLPSISETLFLNGLKWLKAKHGTINGAALADDHMRLNLEEYTEKEKALQAADQINTIAEHTVVEVYEINEHRGTRYKFKLIDSNPQSQKLAA